jgi:cytidyltransferase-like protein
MGKVVYSYYCLDIIHPGHLLQMKNGKRLAGENGVHIVGILTDEAVMEKKKRPVISFDERMTVAEAIKYADLVVPQETYSPHPNVLKMKPDILMESASHSEELIKESERIMSSIGGKVIVTPYYPTQSSTSIKEKIKHENVVTGSCDSYACPSL